MTEEILNETDQPVAIEDTTTTEQEAVVPYPVINTVDVQAPFEPEETFDEIISIKTMLTNKDRMISSTWFDEDKLKALSESRKVSLLEHIEESCRVLGTIIDLIDTKPRS